MKRALVLWLCLMQAHLFAVPDCSTKNEQCLKVVQDYKDWVGLLQVRNEIVAKQRDEALKDAASKDRELPTYFWVILGVFTGASAVLVLK